MIDHGIITAPRPKSTLGASIETLRRAGFDGDVLISSDGDVVGSEIPGTTIRFNPVALGNLRNWVQCLSLLASSGTQAEWLCVSEDDVTWVPDCRPHLERDLRSLAISDKINRVGALSLYFPIAMSREIEDGKTLGPGWHEATRGIKTWGAQCFLFTRKMAIDLLDSPHLKEYLSDPRWTKNVDGIVADVLAKHSLSILYRVPCLVNHDLGEGNSSLGYPADRPKLRTRYYTGTA